MHNNVLCLVHTKIVLSLCAFINRLLRNACTVHVFQDKCRIFLLDVQSGCHLLSSLPSFLYAHTHTHHFRFNNN